MCIYCECSKRFRHTHRHTHTHSQVFLDKAPRIISLDLALRSIHLEGNCSIQKKNIITVHCTPTDILLRKQNLHKRGSFMWMCPTVSLAANGSTWDGEDKNYSDLRVEVRENTHLKTRLAE